MQSHTTQTKQVGVFPCRGWVAPCQRAAGSIKGPQLLCQRRRSWPRIVGFETEAAALSPIRRQFSNPQAADDLNGDQRQMNRDKESARQRHQEWRHAENRGAHDLGEADVTLRQTVMEKVECLHDKESDVCVGRRNHS